MDSGKFCIFASLFMVNLLLLGCTDNSNIKKNDGRIIVVTSFYPLYDITKNITDGKAAVSSLVPSGVEPHDYEPTSNQIIDLNRADVFVVLGTGFEAIENKLRNGLKNTVLVIDASDGILLNVDNLGEDGQTLASSVADPHIWLSPKRMSIMARNIYNGIKQIGKTNAVYYENKYIQYSKELDKLDLEYKQGLANCKKHTIITSHKAFSYLSKDYGFTQIFISGLTPEAEPKPQELIKLINAVRKNNVDYVFYEELLDPRVAKTIASEARVKILELNPIEGTKNPNDNYFSLMRKNLANLKVAMDCG